MDNDKIKELVMLYFKHNPNMNKGIGYKVKAWDTISLYANKHNKKYEDIKHCIESQPMCRVPIWNQFYNYFFKKKNNNTYKNSISDSINPDDWL